MKHINKNEDLKKAIEGDLVLVDFFATWCGPCQMLSPLLENLEKNHEIEVVKVDVDKNPDIAREHGILSIPVLELYKKGKLVNKAIGYLTKEELEDFIK